MKYTKFLNICGGAILSVALSAYSLSAQSAEDNLTHGTGCMSSNTLTGANFHWNINGIRNNDPLANRFVVCPITVDRFQWDGTPRLFASVNMFLPPNFGAPGANAICWLRATRFNGLITADENQTIIVNQTFFVGGFNGNALQGDHDSGTTAVNVINNSNDTYHILCLLPRNGGILEGYRTQQQ